VYSFSIDYLFNRVYDGLLWIRYVWYFWIRRMTPEEYLANVADPEWDGLRERGWINVSENSSSTNSSSLDFLNNFGINTTKDTDGDGIPDIRDPKTFDPNNLTTEKIKEIFGDDLSWTDHLRMWIGMKPRDFDGDGVPDSFESAHGMDPNNPDTDHDGMLDLDELFKGTDPIKADSDGDGVLDGRDAYSLDPYRTYDLTDIDTDGDGVGDRYESLLGTNPNSVDTDGDGIYDNIDQYPTDPNNTSNVAGLLHSVSGSGDGGLVFSIQNHFLSFVVDVLSLLTLFLLPVFIFIFYLWFMRMRHATEHYEHLFHDAIGYKGVFDKHGTHHKNEAGHKEEKEVVHAHNPHVVAHEVEPPKESEYKKHPRWAMIEDYMSGDHETLWRIGILEADNLLNDAMRAAGYAGEDLGEMLKEARFRSIDLAWDAHKMRNRIAHEGMKFTLTEREARRVFAMYEAVFKELKVI
jgi:hypothetical protein